MEKTQAMTFVGTKEEFGKFLSFLSDYCLMNPGMTLGEFVSDPSGTL